MTKRFVLWLCAAALTIPPFALNDTDAQTYAPAQNYGGLIQYLFARHDMRPPATSFAAPGTQTWFDAVTHSYTPVPVNLAAPNYDVTPPDAAPSYAQSYAPSYAPPTYVPPRYAQQTNDPLPPSTPASNYQSSYQSSAPVRAYAPAQYATPAGQSYDPILAPAAAQYAPAQPPANPQSYGRPQAASPRSYALTQGRVQPADYRAEAEPAASPQSGISPVYMRQEVDYAGQEKPGTVIIDTPDKFLFLVERHGKALRYGIGVGRPGYEWAGIKKITRKAEWPAWIPPSDMLKRRPDLPAHLDGGPDNPLGARALYLGSSLYRIHGTNQPETIGEDVSSGCIRMMNDDIIDLYKRVRVGTKVVVM